MTVGTKQFCTLFHIFYSLLSIQGKEEANRPLPGDATESSSIRNEFPECFVQWVAHGGTFRY